MFIVRFFYEDVKFRLLGVRKTKSWVKKVFTLENKALKEVNYIFCSDSFLAKINLRYLNHATYTDIITFDNTDGNVGIQGDIYISVDRVKENALKLQNSFNDELSRVIIHGALHLMGYSDKSSKQKKVMREKEDACLSLRPL